MEQDLDVWKRWMAATARAERAKTSTANASTVLRDDATPIVLTEQDRNVVRGKVGAELALIRHWLALPGEMRGDTPRLLPAKGEGVVHPPVDVEMTVEEAAKVGLLEWLTSKGGRST